MHSFWNLLILMVVIWTAGRLFKGLGLPEVFGELVGGIVVGPALLGIVDADSEVLRVLSELGIFFLMVHTGLKIDPKELLHSAKPSMVIALGGTILPFAACYGAARWFGMSNFSSLFLALTLSISSLPLVARLFKDAKLEDSRVAHASVGASIVTDVGALVAFALLVQAGSGESADIMALARVLLAVVAFFIGVTIVGLGFRRYLPLILKRGNRSFTVSLILALCIGLIGEYAGLHMIIGGFLAGLFIHEEVMDAETFARIEDRYYALTYGFFAPIFFATLAFQLDFGALTGNLALLATLTLAAAVGKIVGSGGAALAVGFSRPASLLAGLAMNTRGAVELVIASIGLGMGVIDRQTFSVVIAVAVITTLLSLAAVPWAARAVRLGEVGK